MSQSAVAGPPGDEDGWPLPGDPSVHVGTRHHLVPRFYLERFARDDRIAVVNPQTGARRVAPIRDTAAEKDFYTFVNTDGELDGRMEQLLGKIEGDAADAIRNMTSIFGGDVSPEDRVSEDATQPYPWQVRKLGTYASGNVENALYDLAVHSDTQGPVAEAAIDALNARNLTRGVRVARHVIVRRSDTRPTGTLFRLPWRRAVHATAALVNSPAAADDLDNLLALLAQPSGFAADVIAQTGSGAYAGTSWPTLDADQLATLYLWARRTLPRPPEYAPHTVYPVNDVHDFPSHVFNRLAALDTPDAVAAVERIADELDESWPRRSAADIAKRVREKAWTPLTLQAVAEILAHPSRRAVTSEQQLARVLLDVIDEVTALIAHDPDTASLFWHKQSGTPTTWRPVDEPTFTTRFVALLRARLDTIVVRQEGQLHLKIGDITGSFPDIEAVTVHDGVQLAVVGEAKGNWNDEVLTAIDTQLTQRYVTGVRTSTGIYLVAYFASDKWDPADYRRRDARTHEETELRKTLEEAARTLSVSGKAIHVRVIPIAI